MCHPAVVLELEAGHQDSQLAPVSLFFHVFFGKLRLISSSRISTGVLGKSGIGLLLIPNSGFRKSNGPTAELRARASLLTFLFNSQPCSLNEMEKVYTRACCVMAHLNHIPVYLSYVRFDLVEWIGNSDWCKDLYFDGFSRSSTRPHTCIAKFVRYVGHRGI